MKKFTLHLDAIIVIVIAFALSLGFIAFQRNQYADLHKKYIVLNQQATNSKMSLIYTKKSLKTCEEKITEQTGQMDH